MLISYLSGYPLTGADDILLPGVKLFEKAMNALAAHPKIDLCFF